MTNNELFAYILGILSRPTLSVANNGILLWAYEEASIRGINNAIANNAIASTIGVMLKDAT